MIYACSVKRRPVKRTKSLGKLHASVIAEVHFERV